MAAHHHRDLEHELVQLRARLIELERQVRAMRVLQAAARVLLGLAPEPPGEE